MFLVDIACQGIIIYIVSDYSMCKFHNATE